MPDLGDENGTSMVEVMVGLAMGMIVLAGLAMLLIVVTRGNARIGARAEASDNARVTMTRIMEELHSACVEPTLAPVQTTSTPARLIFKRGTYGGQSSASAGAITTEIEYLPNRTLVEKTNGGPPRIMLTNVDLSKDPSNPKKTVPIFRYYNFTVNGETPFEMAPNGTLSTNAANTILVKVAFKASPKSEPVADASAATEIENSATLRLTPPTYREGEKAKPCE